MKRRALVTGGAGFIGSHLCKRLLEMDYHVTCIDNLFTGSIKNIEALMNSSDFIFEEHDVTLPYYGVFDEIYNFACPASPIHYQFNPIKTFKTSVFGAFNMLSLAKGCNAKILQASTSEVYGDPLMHPQKEEYWGNVNPIGKRSCYDEGKRAAETIFNTYGPNMCVNDGRVVSNFIVQALKNEDITIYGNGLQTRSFQFIDNLIDGIINVMKNTADDFTGPINLGSTFEYTMKELAEKVIELTNSKSQIVYKPLPMDDPKQRKPDLTLAKSMFNYNPETKNTSIIFLTALDDEDNHVKGFTVGADDYISKPFKTDILNARVLYQIKQIQAYRTIEEQKIKLEHTVASRDKMYSVIAHDLRSPLGTIKMIQEMILESIDQSTFDKGLYDMLLDAKYMTEETFILLDNLLKWTKSNTNKLNIVFQEVNIIEHIHSLIDVFQSIAKTKSIIITDSHPDTSLMVKVDVDLIKTIVRNLLSNAIKFSDEGKNIEINIYKKEGEAIIDIKDNGIGIKPEAQEKIRQNISFTTYGTKSEEGSGLGLSLCIDFIKKNNGKFWFSSEYGKGSTFSFSFPLI